VQKCEPCPVFASFALAFALQLRKKHGKISIRVRKTSVRLRKSSKYSIHITKNSHTLQNLHKHTHYKTHSHTHTHTHTHYKQYKTTTVQIKTKCIEEKQHNGKKEQYLVSKVVNPQV
jgi:hypothetical protein